MPRAQLLPRARLVGLATVVVAVLAACGGGSTAAPPTTLPGDLVPAAASAATVTVTAGATAATVPSSAVQQVLPLLVRRVFEAQEPLAGYGLDQPRATITFLMADGSTVVLRVGSEEFDKSATYVQRDGDGRVWIVLDQSLAPLLSPAGVALG